MATEDKYVITVVADAATTNLQNLLNKINLVYGGLSRLKTASVDTARGLTRYTVEVNNSKVAVQGLNNANRSLVNSVTGVNSAIAKSTRVTRDARQGFSNRLNKKLKAQNLPKPNTATYFDPLAMSGGYGEPYPRIPSMGPIQAATIPDFPSIFDQKSGRGGRKNPNASSEILPLPGQQSGSPDFNAAESDDLATGRTSKPTRSPWSLARGARPRSMAMASNISHKTYTTAVKRQKQEQKQISLFTKFGNGMKTLTKQTFMLQMGMLGVAFSSQSVIASLQGLAMQSLTGLADTEGAIQNAILSSVFGSDVMGGMGVSIEDIVQSSIKAKGVLADLNSILVLIAAKVLADPEVMKAITDAIKQVTAKLSDEKFIQSIKDIVIEVAKAAPKLMDVLPPLADFIKKLGEEGLLDKIILLVGACMLLMPVFASLQLLLLIIASPEILGALLGGLAILIFLFQTAQDLIKKFNTIMEIISDPLGNITDIFYLLWDCMLGIISPLKIFSDFITNLYDLMTGKQDLMKTGSNMVGSALTNNPGGAVYNIIFNKPVGNQSVAEVTGAIKGVKARGYDRS